MGQTARSKARPKFQQDTMVIVLVTWDVSVGSFPALPCLILLAVGTNFRIVAVPCLGHGRCIGTGITEYRWHWGAGVQQECEGRAFSSVWGSSSSEISSNAGGVSWWGYVWPVIWVLCPLRLCPGGEEWEWGHSFPRPPRTLLLRRVWGPTCPSCWCFPAQECFEVTFGFEEACLGWRLDRLITEMVCFYFTPSYAKTGAGPRL